MRDIKYQLIWQGAIYEPLDMREIICGQWEIEGKMYEDNEINGNKKGDYVSIPRKDYVFFSEDEDDRGIWRQSTGLTDKKGVDIFDGDIVRFSDDGYGIVSGEVHFERRGFCIKYKAELCDVFLCMSVYELEIIGNIYQNPELLTN